MIKRELRKIMFLLSFHLIILAGAVMLTFFNVYIILHAPGKWYITLPSAMILLIFTVFVASRVEKTLSKKWGLKN